MGEKIDIIHNLFYKNTDEVYVDTCQLKIVTCKLNSCKYATLNKKEHHEPQNLALHLHS